MRRLLLSALLLAALTGCADADKPLLGTLEYGLPSDHLQEGIAAALHYRNADDPQAVELQQLLAELGPAQALARITGLAADSDIVSAIVTRYGNLK